MANSRVAVVTGANKGIGYAAVKGLSKEFDGIIYLTARNEKLGRNALEKLKREVDPKKADFLRFHQLEITDKDSRQRLHDHLKKEHGRLDILVNNAGIAYSSQEGAVYQDSVPFADQAVHTMNINYFGTKDTTEILMPLLRPHARVVNVASRVGQLANFSPELKKKVLDPNITVEQISELMETFVKAAKEGKHLDLGFPKTAYGVSKVGFVATDLTLNNPHAMKPEQGADTIVYLATIPPDTPGMNGEFWAERKTIDWENFKMSFGH